MPSPTSSNPFSSLLSRIKGSAPEAQAAAPASTAAAAATVAPQEPVSVAAVAEPVVPTAPAFALSSTTERLKSVAVIVGHADGRVAQSLTGVVGQIEDNKFTIDPCYAEISYLFTLDSTGDVDVGGARYEEIPMLESDVAAFRANMIRGSAALWDKLYSGMGLAGGQIVGDVVQRMLAAERKKVESNVKRFLASQALGNYLVPVVIRVSVPQSETALNLDDPTVRATEADLAKEGFFHAYSMRIDAARECVLAPEITPSSPPLADDLRRHTGSFDLQVDTTVAMLAANPDQAMRVMMNVMIVANRSMDMVRNVLTCGPCSIKNAVKGDYQVPTDDDNESGNGDYRDRGG